MQEVKGTEGWCGDSRGAWAGDLVTVLSPEDSALEANLELYNLGVFYDVILESHSIWRHKYSIT